MNIIKHEGVLSMLYQKHTKEFKKEACELVLKDGLPVKGVAEKLGIKFQVLYRWLDEYKTYGEEAFVGSGHLRSQDAELKKLQKELKELRIENEILKKAAAYFAKHPADE